MSTQLETALLKKTPCNGCRERKRKCSYEQPCARCVKFNVECVYIVMPSPKDIEYIQELEYMKHIEQIQHQITCMEEEMAVLKLAKENDQPPVTKAASPASPDSPPLPQCNSSLPITKKFKTAYNEDANIYHDYPSPVSITDPDDLMHKMIHKQYYSSEYLPNRFLTAEPHRTLDYYNKMDGNDTEIVKKAYHEYFLNLSEVPVANIAGVEAVLTKKEDKPAQPWTLTVRNGKMSIETHIKSYQELMAYVETMVPTSLYHKNTNNLPFPLTHPVFNTPQSAIGQVLGILIWRKYGKSRFKSMTKFTPALLPHVPYTEVTKVSPPADMATITMRLVHTYLQCQHLRFLYSHKPTLIRLFMKDEHHVMNSPVIMAMCSSFAVQSCNHLHCVISMEAMPDYGAYYFERARELIADKFDEADLETMMTYTFMAIYKIKCGNDDEAEKYVGMAERVYHMLLPQYQFVDGEPNSNEAILFSRMYRCIYHARSVLELHKMQENMYSARSLGPKRLFKLLDNQDDVDIYIAKDDSPQEIKFIKMKRYMKQLRTAIKEGTRRAAAVDFPSYIGVFGHHMEMAMRNWYRNVLPPDYQLSLPLFEDNTPDIEFFTKLELECGDTPVPALTTIMLYNEYLIMSKAYLPKDPRSTELNTEGLMEKLRGLQQNIPIEELAAKDSKTRHWLKLMEGMRHHRARRPDHFVEEDDTVLSEEEYFSRFFQALNISRLDFNMPFIHTSIRTALNMVRLFQFLKTRDCSCFLDLRWVMNAWEILLRAARFKYQQPGDVETTLDRIRANLLLCLEIIRQEILYNRRDNSGAQFIECLEIKFNELYSF